MDVGIEQDQQLRVKVLGLSSGPSSQHPSKTGRGASRRIPVTPLVTRGGTREPAARTVPASPTACSLRRLLIPWGARPFPRARHDTRSSLARQLAIDARAPWATSPGRRPPSTCSPPTRRLARGSRQAREGRSCPGRSCPEEPSWPSWPIPRETRSVSRWRPSSGERSGLSPPGASCARTSGPSASTAWTASRRGALRGRVGPLAPGLLAEHRPRRRAVAGLSPSFRWSQAPGVRTGRVRQVPRLNRGASGPTAARPGGRGRRALAAARLCGRLRARPWAGLRAGLSRAGGRRLS